MLMMHLHINGLPVFAGKLCFYKKREKKHWLNCWHQSSPIPRDFAPQSAVQNHPSSQSHTWRVDMVLSTTLRLRKNRRPDFQENQSKWPRLTVFWCFKCDAFILGCDNDNMILWFLSIFDDTPSTWALPGRWPQNTGLWQMPCHPRMPLTSLGIVLNPELSCKCL